MTRSRAVAAGFAAMFVALGATPAFGASPSGANSATHDVTAPVIPAGWTLERAISTTEAELSSRASALATLSAAVSSSTTLTATDRAELTTLLATDTSGIGALETAVSSESTVAAVAHDAATMVLAYHVLAFAKPVTTTVLSLDASLSTANRLSAQLPPLQAAIAAAHLSGRTDTAATLRQLSHLLSLVQSSAGETSADLLGLLPSSIPGSLPTIAAAVGAAARAAAEIALAQNDLAQLARDIARVGTVGAQHAAARLRLILAEG